jgi:hypothetical protein
MCGCVSDTLEDCKNRTKFYNPKMHSDSLRKNEKIIENIDKNASDKNNKNNFAILDK